MMSQEAREVTKNDIIPVTFMMSLHCMKFWEAVDENSVGYELSGTRKTNI